MLDGHPVPLPRVLSAWSRVGRAFGLRTRLRVTARLSRNLLRSHTTYLGADGLVLEVDPGDPFQAMMLLGLYDTVVEAILRHYTPVGGTVIDAGAHFGYFSLRMARLVGPDGSIHAFECDPRLLPRLRRHVEINGADWITVNECGLLDRSSEEEQLYLPGQLGWASTLSGAWGATEVATVAMITLDEYLDSKGVRPETLSLIKLDVEGCELPALHGARNTLAETSAPVLVEFLPARMRAMGQDPSDLLSLMAELGYAPWCPVMTRTGRLRLERGTQPPQGDDVLFLKPPVRDGHAAERGARRGDPRGGRCGGSYALPD
jgi:FkbM family methyltransferase